MNKCSFISLDMLSSTNPLWQWVMLTIMVFTINHAAHAQHADLKAVLEEHPQKDSSYVNKLLALQESCLYNRTDSSILIGLKIVDLSESLSYTIGLVDSYQYLATAYALLEKYELAESYASKSIQLADQHNLVTKSLDAKTTLAAVYGYKREYVKARYNYLQLLLKADSLQDKALMSYINLGLGGICYSINDYDEALSYFIKSASWATESGKVPDVQADAFMGMGKSFFFKKEYVKADSCYQIGKKKFIELNDVHGWGSALINLSHNFLEMGNVEAARKHMLDVETLYKTHGIATGQNEINLVRGIIHLKANEPEQAIVYLERTIPTDNKEEEAYGVYENYSYLAEAYSQLGSYEKAYECRKKAYALRKKFINEEVVNKLISVQNEYDQAIQENKLKELASINEVKELTLKNEKKTKWLLGGGAGILGIVVFLLVMGFKTKAKLSHKLHDKYEEVIRQNEMIESINMDLKDQAIRAQMNPHFVFNCLNSIQYLVVKGDTVTACHYMSIFAQLLRNVLEYSDRQWVSVKEEMDMLRLYVELESLRFKDDFEYNISFVKSGSFLDSELIPSMVVQPFVENSIVHGFITKLDKKRLEVEFLKNDRGNIVCRISDNGIGRDAAEVIKSRTVTKHKSKALELIEKRLEVLGEQTQSHSRIEIVDLLDQKQNIIGTQVTLEFPHA